MYICYWLSRYIVTLQISLIIGAALCAFVVRFGNVWLIRLPRTTVPSLSLSLSRQMLRGPSVCRYAHYVLYFSTWLLYT